MHQPDRVVPSLAGKIHTRLPIVVEHTRIGVETKQLLDHFGMSALGSMVKWGFT